MSEQQPVPYEFKNPHKMTLAYTGIASDIMELDDPTADGYMGVTDARASIVIEKAQPHRVFDYEGSGTVRVAKMLELPRLELPHRKRHFSTELSDGTYIVQVDDQELAREINDQGFERGTFDSRFVDTFRDTVQSALKDCLKREKLLNNGNYNVDFITSQYFFLGIDVFATPALVGTVALSGHPFEAVEAGIILNVGHHILIHGIKMSRLMIRRMDNWLLGEGWEERYPRFMRDAHPDDPFSRQYLKKPWEMLLPPVPVDRLARGLLYLHQHGDDLIKSCIDQESE